MFETGAMKMFSIRIDPIVGEVVEDRPAEKAGFMAADIITSIDGEKVEYWDEFANEIKTHKSEEVWVGIEREGKADSILVETDSLGTVGIAPNSAGYNGLIKNEKFSFFGSLPEGTSLAYWTLHDYASQFKFVFTSKGASSMGGFGAFGKMFHPEWHWQSFWLNTALISIILAFMNFLPIPALDGGHIVFLLYEMISGRKPNQKVLEYAQLAGFVFILGLVLYANGNDIYKAITGG